MREIEFEKVLISDPNIVSKIKGVSSRISKARMIERYINTSLDTIVCNDNKMYDTLVRIKHEMKDTNGNISNAIRKYYQFTNERVFPALSKYKR